MVAYHPLPNCMEMKETVNDGSEYISTKVLQRQTTGLLSSVSGQDWSDLPEGHLYAFVEAALSPAKYALFQYFGCSFMSTTSSNLPPLLRSTLSSVKIGAFGGTILTLLYFALLLKRKDDAMEKDTSTSESVSSCAAVLIKEMAYSAIAATIGVLGCGKQDAFCAFVVAGAIGPFILFAVMFGILGVGIGAIWSVERFKDWYAGY